MHAISAAKIDPLIHHRYLKCDWLIYW